MARRPRGSVVNRRHLARLERENIQNKYILYGTIGVIALVVVMVVAGIVYDQVIVARQPVAIVNGEEISTREFQARVKYERSNLVSQYQSTLQTAQSFADPQFVAFFQNSLNQIELQLNPPDALGRNVLNTLIEDRLIRQKAAELGITVTEEEIQNTIEESFGFFDGEQPPTPTSVPTTEATSTLTAQQMTLTAPTATPILTATLTITATETISLTTTAEATPTLEATADGVQATPTGSGPTPTATPSPTPTPYTQDAFQTDYQTSLEQWDATIGFSEKDLRYLIESFLYRRKLLEALTVDLPREEEQVWARHILVGDELTAEEVYNRLVAGEDFASLAAEYSTDTSNATRGGDLGWFGKGVMAEEFEVAAFNTPVGEISTPIQTTFGWHVIQVLGHEIRPLSASEYDQLRQTEFQEWLTEERELQDPNIQIFDYWADRVPDTPTVQHVDLQSALGIPTQVPAVTP